VLVSPDAVEVMSKLWPAVRLTVCVNVPVCAGALSTDTGSSPGVVTDTCTVLAGWQRVT
jgi:hypothetical protein